MMVLKNKLKFLMINKSLNYRKSTESKNLKVVKT